MSTWKEVLTNDEEEHLDSWLQSIQDRRVEIAEWRKLVRMLRNRAQKRLTRAVDKASVSH